MTSSREPLPLGWGNLSSSQLQKVQMEDSMWWCRLRHIVSAPFQNQSGRSYPASRSPALCLHLLTAQFLEIFSIEISLVIRKLPANFTENQSALHPQQGVLLRISKVRSKTLNFISNEIRPEFNLRYHGSWREGATLSISPISRKFITWLWLVGPKWK